MKEAINPSSGLQDVDPLRKGLEDEEERKRREQMQKALTDRPKPVQTGLIDKSEP